MYLRRTQRRRKDGSVVGYLGLAHNRRVDGVTRAEVLLNLGREDELDVDALRRLAASITRFADGDGAGQPLGSEAGEGGGDGDLEVASSRALGGVWLLDALWRRLGIGEALAGVLGARRFSTDIERVLFAMVANRALDPCSKLACSEWAREDVAITGLDEIDEDHCYRAMDLLVEADTEGKVQEAVFFACADLLNLEVDLLFFDTTSTYFERDEPDPTGLGGRQQLRRRFADVGHPQPAQQRVELVRERWRGGRGDGHGWVLMRSECSASSSSSNASSRAR